MNNNIISGVNNISTDLNGKSVAEIRQMLGQALNIAPDSRPVVNGNEASEDYILESGDELEFVKASGEKG
jgi:hypothetical protein